MLRHLEVGRVTFELLDESRAKQSTGMRPDSAFGDPLRIASRSQQH